MFVAHVLRHTICTRVWVKRSGTSLPIAERIMQRPKDKGYVQVGISKVCAKTVPRNERKKWPYRRLTGINKTLKKKQPRANTSATCDRMPQHGMLMHAQTGCAIIHRHVSGWMDWIHCKMLPVFRNSWSKEEIKKMVASSCCGVLVVM